MIPWTRVVDCDSKIDQGRHAMFLSLPLLNICSNGRVFCILDALVEKMINHVVLIWAIKFNFKQVKVKSLEVCTAWKVMGFLEFYIFPGYKNINMLKTVLKKTLWTFFYGWSSTGSRLEPLRGGSLHFTTKFPEIPGYYFIDLRRIKGWVNLKATQWFWTRLNH